MRIAIALAALLLIGLLEWQRPTLVRQLDEAMRDHFLRFGASTLAETRLVVVDIDEASLAALGPWPWPRQRMANLAEILLSVYAARAVGLDVVFPEPGDADGDARLASLAKYAPVTFAQIFDYVERSARLQQGQLSGGQAGSTVGTGVLAHGYIANHAGLSAARCAGNIGFVPDDDGVLRHVPLLTDFQGRSYSYFASSLLVCGGGLLQFPPDQSPRQWRIPFNRSLSAYTVIPASDILDESAPRELIAGRYVLVGSSSLVLGDKTSTPLASISAGVMVHASALSGLLDLAEGQIRPPWAGREGMLVWSVLSLGVALLGLALRAAWAYVGLFVGLATAWIGVAFFGVARQAEWSVSAPLFGYFFLLLVAVPHEWWQAQRHSKRLLATFSHYVAAPVLDEIIRLDLQHSLVPTLCHVTVLVADMEGYTRTTSTLSLADAAQLTKDFLDCLTLPVLTERGTLDKYTGDGLVAFWGAPLPCTDHADRAVSAALAILDAVDAFNAMRRTNGLEPVRVRIGIESGHALVGDLGTAFRSTYTAVGDCINFASRLEAAARDLPTRLVIGAESKVLLVKHATQSLGSIALRGTDTTIEVFTVPGVV